MADNNNRSTKSAISPAEDVKTASARTAITPGLAVEFNSSAANTTEEPPINEATINAMRAGNLFGKSKDALKEAPPPNEIVKVVGTPTKTTATAVEPVTPISTAATPMATPKTAIRSTTTTPRTAVQSTPTTPRTAIQSAMTTPKTAVQSSSIRTPRTAIQSTVDTPKTAILSSMKTPRTAVQSTPATPKTAIQSTMNTPTTAMSCGRSLKTPMSAPKTTISSKTPLHRALGTTTPKTAVTRTPLNTAATPGIGTPMTAKARTSLNTANSPTQLNTAAPGQNSSKSPFLTPHTAVSTPRRNMNTAITPGELSCKTAKTLRTPGDTSTKTAKALRTPGDASMKAAKVLKTPSVAAVPPLAPQTPKIKTANTNSCKTAKSRFNEQKTPVTSGQKKARRSLFPNVKIQEPSKSASRSSGQKKRAVNSKRSPMPSAASAKSGRSSIVTGRSFDPPGTPHTCNEIPPRVLAEQKAEQQKIVLTSSTVDGQFNVEIRIKMKVVGGNTEPQAMFPKKITVNGEEKYSSRQL